MTARPRFQPTQMQRYQVAVFRREKISKEAIARALRIDVPTLEEHFASELADPAGSADLLFGRELTRAAEAVQLKKYLAFGRRYEKLSDTSLSAEWVAAFRAMCAQRSQVACTNEGDLRSELSIRGIEPPFESVAPEQAALIEEIRALPRPSPDDIPPEAKTALDEILSEMQRPTN